MPEFSPGLEGVVAAETAVSEVDGANGRLIYRGGYLIEDLAAVATFEETAYLLWNGDLPDKAELEALHRRMAAARNLKASAKGALSSMDPATDPMDTLRTVISAQGATNTLTKPTLDEAIALTAVAIRGGVQMKPLAPAQAAVSNHSGLAQLTMNSSFTMLRNSGKPSLKRQHFFDNPAALRQFLQSQVEGESLMSGPGARDNVVILVVESLSAEYCGAGNGGGRYTPFLDSLAERSVFFRNHYANGRRSIEVMPSILAGLPSLMELAFTESRYCDQSLLGLGTLLVSNGYTTSFFHGATKGTMRFDLFMRVAEIVRIGITDSAVKK